MDMDDKLVAQGENLISPISFPSVFPPRNLPVPLIMHVLLLNNIGTEDELLDSIPNYMIKLSNYHTFILLEDFQ